MLATILGAILILVPFILIFYFKNRILGFLYIFTVISAWHLMSAILMQALHLFHYSFVLTSYIIPAVGVVVYAIKQRKKASFKIKLSWQLIIAVAVILFELFSVHYFYTGTITNFLGDTKVHSASYPYPYFSDEWAGVAFTKHIIESASLPIVHPMLGYGTYNFPNIFVAFFAGLAEVFLILGLSPLTGYPIISIFTGSLICLLAYLFLRTANVKQIFAILGALSLPWIINSAKLPGIWYLFPFIGGSIFFLISITALNLKSKILGFLSGFISLLLYPPFVVFIVPTLLTVFLKKDKEEKNNKNFLMVVGLIALTILATLIVIIVQTGNLQSLYNFFLRSIVRLNNEGCIPIRRVWEVVPWPLLPLSVFGIVEAVKKKMYNFLVPLIIALIYWLIYSFSEKFFIIDYARIAAISSFLLVIASGLGASSLFGLLEKRFKIIKQKNNFFIIQLIILLIFSALAFSYTKREAWRQIIHRYDNGWEAPIISPANQFLHADDLKLFSGLSRKRFISPPWKGLVIGAATLNYPLHNKASIISTEIIKYDVFNELSCVDKIKASEKINLDYAYTPKFSCPRFEYIGHSQEGLYLYKFQK